MRVKHRHAILLVFITMILLSLACTLGGTQAAPTNTPVALITTTITFAPPTLLGPAVTPTPSNTPPGPLTNTPIPTATPIVGSGPGGCVLKGTYVADVTIPDGTVLAPNAPFPKAWRIKNDGTCNWDAGYQLVFAEGNQMSGPAAVNIPAAAPGQTIDISVNLAAPGAPGDYAGRWRLRASNGAIFGGYTVVIKVAGTPTPTATATRTPTPSVSPTLAGGGIWGGAWETSCCGQMNLVQSGNRVTGLYDNSRGSIDGAVSGNRLSGAWALNPGSPGSTSGTFDFWIEGSGLRWHGNWNNTQPWCGQRAGQMPLSPCGVSRWYSMWTIDCAATDASVCGEMSLNQSGDSVSGTYANGAGVIDGTVKDAELMGTWTRNPGSPSSTSGAFKFFMTSDGRQFQGNWNTSNAWCGYRSGSSLPSPCRLP